MAGKIVLGMLLSLLVGGVGYAKKSLSLTGVLGAVLVGTAIFAGGGPLFFCVLIAFFVSSSFLSHFRKEEKENLLVDFEKGGRRDLGQALANGGAGALFSIIYHFLRGDPQALAGFVGAMSTVTADTWATEIGLLSRADPVHIISRKCVPRGTSGAVSLYGNTAMVLGSAFIGISAIIIEMLFPLQPRASWQMLLFSSLAGGIVGALTDSLLGAVLQGQYFCRECSKQTEKKIHRCGSRTEHLRGFPWLGNDLVNFCSSLAGAGAAALCSGFFP